MMPITFELPRDVEQMLRQELGDLNQAAKEAALVELYRQDKLSHHELAQALGLDRFETDGILKKHNVTEDLRTSEELARDFERLAQMVKG